MFSPLLFFFLFAFPTFSTKTNGGEGYRSPCPSHAKRMLYHMSYTPFHLLVFRILFLYLPFYTYILLEKMHPVGFEPTHLAIAVLETAPLDHSGTNAYVILLITFFTFLLFMFEKKFVVFKNASGGVRTHASLDSRA